MTNTFQKDSPQTPSLVKEASTLSDAELLAIVLGYGHSPQLALTWATDYLNKWGNLSRLLAAQPELLTLLNAGTELSRRHQRAGEGVTQETEPLSHAQPDEQPEEIFLGLFFDAEQHLICLEELLCGSKNDTTLLSGDPLINEVVKRTVQYQASAVTIMHYSPNGTECPMLIDRLVKQGLYEALPTCQASLLQYLIIGKGNSLIFR